MVLSPFYIQFNGNNPFPFSLWFSPSWYLFVFVVVVSFKLLYIICIVDFFFISSFQFDYSWPPIRRFAIVAFELKLLGIQQYHMFDVTILQGTRAQKLCAVCRFPLEMDRFWRSAWNLTTCNTRRNFLFSSKFWA